MGPHSMDTDDEAIIACSRAVYWSRRGDWWRCSRVFALRASARTSSAPPRITRPWPVSRLTDFFALVLR